MLLERDGALAALKGALGRVRDEGDGALVAVAGEAGVGKTSLLRAFGEQCADVAVWWGLCDNLRAPRPLGPLVDIARDAGAPLSTVLGSGAPRAEVFDATLAAIRAESDGVVVVVEDVHWADDATLDLVRFVGRRLHGVPAMVVLTYRDDEVGPTHPLRRLLGDAPPAERLRLEPLSIGAVAQVAQGSGLDPGDLHRLTGGNPFFVTESIAAGGPRQAGSVRDAVLARAAALDPAARRALDAAATQIHVAALDIIEALTGDAAGIDECVDTGLLVPVDGGVAFRHEIARLAVEDALPPARRRFLHQRAFAALAGRAGDDVLAHHAVAAGDARAVLVHAPIAAAAAASVGSHRTAAELLAAALRCAGGLGVAERAALEFRYANEAALVGDDEAAAGAFERSAALWEEAGNPFRRAEAIEHRSRPLTMLGRAGEAQAMTDQAITILRDLPPGPELAFALVGAVSTRMLARELDEAVALGEEAIAFARSVGHRAHEARALIQTGTAQFMGPSLERGLERVRAGIDVARDLGWDEGVVLGLSQIGSGCGEIRRYDLAVPALEATIAEAHAADLGGAEIYAESWLARCELFLGRWETCGARAGALLARPSCSGIARCMGATTLGLLRARRGDPLVWDPLDEALRIARQSGHLQRLWPVAAARCEAAWLEGRPDAEAGLLRDVHALAAELAYPWAVEELAWWARHLGEEVDVRGAATPFGLQIRGDHLAAAEAWDRLGSPYEGAAARLASQQPDAMAAAYVTLADLGAEPLAARAAQALRDAGERVPRRPAASTRANPFALTARELDVLRLLTESRTNAEIAEELYISAKTAGHHVSSVLAKLGVPDRRKAAQEARRLGIVR